MSRFIRKTMSIALVLSIAVSCMVFSPGVTTYAAGGTVTITPTNGLASPGDVFALTHNDSDPSVEIRYSFSGNPTAASPIYKMPVRIPLGAVTVRAAVFSGSTMAGPVAEQMYLNSSTGDVFKNNVTLNASNVVASTVYSTAYPGWYAVDGDPGTRWATPASTSACTLVVPVNSPVSFNAALIHEYVGGEATRINEFNIEYWDLSLNGGAGGWAIAYSGTAGGTPRIYTFPRVTSVDQVRLNIIRGTGGPTIYTFALYDAESAEDIAVSSSMLTMKPNTVSDLSITGRLADGTTISPGIIDSVVYYSSNPIVTVNNATATLTMGNFTDEQEGAVIDVWAVVTIGGTPYTTGMTKITAASKNKDIQVLRPFIDGLDTVGVRVRGRYYYYDKAGGNPESGTTFRWLSSDAKDGVYTAIVGATGIEYTFTDDDEGKYIVFEVSPKSGGNDGITAKSFPIGPVLSVADYNSINNRLRPGTDFMSNVGNLQGDISRRMANAVYFTVDDGVYHGSDILYFNNARISFTKSTKPVVKDGVVYAPVGFFTNYLSAPALPADFTEDGIDYFDLKANALATGKYYWNGSENNSEVEHYLLSHRGQGLIVISDTDNIFEPVTDRDMINEAVNMLYTLRSTPEQMQWFRDVKFGMFIHWDPCALSNAEVSWSRTPNIHNIDAVYDTLYQRFDPVDYDPDEWCRIAAESGMKYMVLTTKHHNGFANFLSDYSDYTIENSPYRGPDDGPYEGERDLVTQYTEAARKAGMKVGFYYSGQDWYHEYYAPKMNNTTAGVNVSNQYYRFMEFYFGQMEELLTRYNPDYLWFDGIDSVPGDSFNAMDPRTMLRTFRQIVPDIVVNNRFAGWGAAPYDIAGDLNTPEQTIGSFDDVRPWESCMTVLSSNQWSYQPGTSVKSVRTSLGFLISASCGDGNVLYNIGPNPLGVIELPQAASLFAMGDWLKTYGESIYDTRGGPYVNVTWGGSTYKINSIGMKTIYLHVSPAMKPSFVPPAAGGPLTIPLPPDGNNYTKATLLKNGATVGIAVNGANMTLTLPAGELWDTDIDTVIKLETDPVTALDDIIRQAEALAATMTKARLASNKQYLLDAVTIAKAIRAAGDPSFYEGAMIALYAEIAKAKAAADLDGALTELEDLFDILKISDKVIPAGLAASVAAVIEEADSLLENGGTTDELSDMLIRVSDYLNSLKNIRHLLSITFTPERGVVTNGTTFGLYAARSDEFDIRYVFGFGDPTASSQIYLGPVLIPLGVINVRAALFDGDVMVSEVYECAFLNGAPPNEFTGNVTNSNVVASVIYSSGYPGYYAITGTASQRWATPEGTANATLQVTMNQARTFNTAVIQEYVSAGELTRIFDFNIEYQDSGGAWQIAYRGNTGGVQKVYHFPEVTARVVRLNILSCDAVTIYDFKLHNADPPADVIGLRSDSYKLLPDETSQLTIFGTLADGRLISADMADSVEYKADSDLVSISSDGLITMGAYYRAGVRIKVSAVVTFGAKELTTAPITIQTAVTDGKLIDLALGKPSSANSTYAASYAASFAVDGNPRTRWASNANQAPYTFEINFGKVVMFDQVRISEYMENSFVSRIGAFKIQYYSGGQWLDAFDAATGEWDLAVPATYGTATTVDGFYIFLDGQGNVVSLDHTISFPTVASDRIRLYTTSASGPSFYSFNVYCTTGVETTDDFSVFFALYNSGGKLVNFGNSANGFLDGISSVNGYTSKAFLWDKHFVPIYKPCLIF